MIIEIFHVLELCLDVDFRGFLIVDRLLHVLEENMLYRNVWIDASVDLAYSISPTCILALVHVHVL